MPFSLYDATVPSLIQMLTAVDALVGKAEAQCAETGTAPADLIAMRLAEDMLPLGYQVKSCAVHSIRAMRAVSTGSFSPDQSPWPTDFAGLHALLREAIAELQGIDPATINEIADRDMEFRMGDFVVPFTVATFLLSFSQPNFYFHATTTYAILRMAGVKLGKRDYLGPLRIRS